MTFVEIYEQSKYFNYVTILAYVIDKCNYYCQYCYNKKPRSNDKLDLNQLMNLCLFIHKKTNQKIKIEFIGGEPTLHKDLIDFCKNAQLINFIDIFVLTNFSQSLDYYNKLFEYNVTITATWHSIENDLMNTNFIEKVLHIDKKFIKNKQFELRIMFEHNNFQNAYLVFNIFCQNKLKDIIQCGLISVEKYDKHLYSNEQLNAYLKIADQIDNNRKIYHIKYDNGLINKLKFNDLFLNDKFSFMNWSCGAGQTYLYVHSNGDIYPCETYFYDVKNSRIGNICHFDKIKLKKTLCKCKFCTSCDFGILKKKVFL